MKSPADILAFWFSEPSKKRWFKSTDAFDATIRLNFEATALFLVGDKTSQNSWESEGSRSHLALIILLDQSPRHMYRDTSAMFAWDIHALDSAKRLIARKGDLQLSQTERPFAYMPFMHSENLNDQTRCVELCDARLDEESTLRHAKNHRDIIKRFGRFPHRNPILGREMTKAESAFLKNGGFSG